MPPLTSDQLDAIQRLLSEPLRQAVRAEMQAGHERLAAIIDKLAEQLSQHIAETLRRERACDGRIGVLERRANTLEAFRSRILIVYAACTLLMSFVWSALQNWVVDLLRKR